MLKTRVILGVKVQKYHVKINQWKGFQDYRLPSGHAAYTKLFMSMDQFTKKFIILVYLRKYYGLLIVSRVILIPYCDLFKQVYSYKMLESLNQLAYPPCLSRQGLQVDWSMSKTIPREGLSNSQKRVCNGQYWVCEK